MQLHDRTKVSDADWGYAYNQAVTFPVLSVSYLLLHERDLVHELLIFHGDRECKHDNLR